MKKLRVPLIIIGLVVIATISSSASGDVITHIEEGQMAAITPASSMLKVQSISVSHIDSTLCVSFEINTQKVHTGSNRQIVFTPVIKNAQVGATDSIVLDPVVIAGRNRYFSHIRKGNVSSSDSIFRAGDKKIIKYSKCVPWEKWMSNAFIAMLEVTQDCCRPVKPLCETPLVSINSLENSTTDYFDSIGYIPLSGDSTIEMEAQGRAFIDFHVNKWDIDETYHSNSIELDKIIESINLIKNDPDAIITRLSIKGFASPEGNYDNNVRLAMGRTEALKEFVKNKYNFDPEILTTSYEAEDWDGLRVWLDSCSLPHKEEMIAIVESEMDPDSKDSAIKERFPMEYKFLLDEVYPKLRHSDYSIRYKIRVFATDDELKNVYVKSPERLRPVDFYRIANLYPFASKEFEDVLIKASDYHPFDQEAALNAANILMKRGEMEKAADKLSYAGEGGEAYFSRGMLAFANGDLRRAEFLLKKAKDLGIEKAEKQLDILHRVAGNEIISYHIQSGE